MSGAKVNYCVLLDYTTSPRASISMERRVRGAAMQPSTQSNPSPPSPPTWQFLMLMACHGNNMTHLLIDRKHKLAKQLWKII